MWSSARLLRSSQQTWSHALLGSTRSTFLRPRPRVVNFPILQARRNLVRETNRKVNRQVHSNMQHRVAFSQHTFNNRPSQAHIYLQGDPKKGTVTVQARKQSSASSNATKTNGKTKESTNPESTGGSGSGSSSGSYADANTTGEYLLVRLQDLDKHMQYRGYSLLRIGAVLLGCVGFYLYIFRESIRTNVSGEVAEIAGRTIGDKAVVIRVEELSKSLIHSVLSDSEIRDAAQGFVLNLAREQDTVDAINRLVSGILKDEAALETMTSFVKNMIGQVLADKATSDKAQDFLGYLFAQPYTKEILVQLLIDALQNDRFLYRAKVFFVDILASESFTMQTHELSRNVSMMVLDDDKVKTRAKELVKEVLADDSVRMSGGEAMWKAFTWTITPRWFGGRKRIVRSAKQKREEIKRLQERQEEEKQAISHAKEKAINGQVLGDAAGQNMSYIPIPIATG
eukprot:Clim_evm21s164 gene=Clim_evmTU21s164